jgi:hypothetical protein
METGCQYPLCRGSIPLVLEREGLCPLHFLRKVDAECSEIRREAMLGGLDSRRCAEINQFLGDRAMVLAQLATSGTRLRDETRPRLLSVFLMLVNVCERLSRASNEAESELQVTEFRRPVAVGMRR